MEPETRGRTPTVLVADDDPEIVRLVQRALAVDGYEVATASSGTEALSVILAGPPQLVILDVMMPGMSGFELCRRLKADPDLKAVPVILLTALDGTDDRVKGLDLGADDYLTKPFHPRELLARVRSILRLQGLRTALAESITKMQRFNTIVENVAIGLDERLISEGLLERLVIGHLLHGTGSGSRTASLVIIGSPSDLQGAVDGSGYLSRDERTVETFEVTRVPEIIRELPNEISVGLRFGAVPPQAAAAVAARLPDAVGTLTDAAIVAEGSRYLAVFNYEGGVTRFDAEILRGIAMQLTLLDKFAHHHKDLDGAFRYTVGALARAAEALDTDTGNHIARVNAYAELLAVDLGMSATFIEDISLQAQLHDVGKIHIDPGILKKPGKLTAEEWVEMKRHTEHGARIIGDSPRLSMGRSVALSHHERFDGSGYPHGLRGDGIPIEGRIVAVADTYDAIRNARAYKPAMSHDAAVRAIFEGDAKCAAGGFDPRVKEAFAHLEKQFGDLYEKMK